MRCRRWSTRRRTASIRRSTRRRRRPAGCRRTTRTCRTSRCAPATATRIRRAFVARDIGADPMLLAADYSQIELRIMAHLSQDPALIEAFRTDTDIHAATASNVFGVPLDEVTSEQRRRAKVFNFGVLYGLSEYGLSTKERISREEAGEFIRRYFETLRERARLARRRDRELPHARLRGDADGAPALHPGDPLVELPGARRPASAWRSTCRCRARRATSSRSR